MRPRILDETRTPQKMPAELITDEQGTVLAHYHRKLGYVMIDLPTQYQWRKIRRRGHEHASIIIWKYKPTGRKEEECQ